MERDITEFEERLRGLKLSLPDYDRQEPLSHLILLTQDMIDYLKDHECSSPPRDDVSSICCSEDNSPDESEFCERRTPTLQRLLAQAERYAARLKRAWPQDFPYLPSYRLEADLHRVERRVSRLKILILSRQLLESRPA